MESDPRPDQPWPDQPWPDQPRPGLSQRLRAKLTDAVKARDLDAVRALRGTLAAIENAGAVGARRAPAPDGHPHIAGSVHGLGGAEVARRALSRDEVEQIMRREVTDRLDAATEYERAGRNDRAATLRAEAATLAELLDTAECDVPERSGSDPAS